MVGSLLGLGARWAWTPAAASGEGGPVRGGGGSSWAMGDTVPHVFNSGEDPSYLHRPPGFWLRVHRPQLQRHPCCHGDVAGLQCHGTSHGSSAPGGCSGRDGSGGPLVLECSQSHSAEATSLPGTLERISMVVAPPVVATSSPPRSAPRSIAGLCAPPNVAGMKCLWVNI